MNKYRMGFGILESCLRIQERLLGWCLMSLQMWVRPTQVGRVGKGVPFRGSQIKGVHAGNKDETWQGCMRLQGKENGCVLSGSGGVSGGQLLSVAMTLLSGMCFSGLRSWERNKAHSWWKKGHHRADFHLYPSATTATTIAASENIHNNDCQHLLNTYGVSGPVPSALYAISFHILSQTPWRLGTLIIRNLRPREVKRIPTVPQLRSCQARIWTQATLTLDAVLLPRGPGWWCKWRKWCEVGLFPIFFKRGLSVYFLLYFYFFDAFEYREIFQCHRKLTAYIWW